MEDEVLRTTQLLDRLERAIDFPAYLAAHGFKVVPRSSEWGVTMEGTGGVVTLTMDPNKKKWTYAPVASSVNQGLKWTAEIGGVTDFMMRSELLCFRNATTRLGSLLEAHSGPNQLTSGKTDNLVCLYRQLHRNRPLDLQEAVLRHELGVREQLEVRRRLESLGVHPETLDDEGRFRPIRRMADATTLLCSTSPWRSTTRLTDERLVFLERPLDALAYEQLHERGRTAYVALGTSVGPDIRAWAIEVAAQWRREHPGTEIVVAFGRDRSGQQLANAASDLVIDAAGPPPAGTTNGRVQMERAYASRTPPPQVARSIPVGRGTLRR